MGNLPTPELNETVVFQCLRHSNWIICSTLSPFCSGNFQKFSLSYWEANSYYPRGLIVGKGTISNSKTEWDRGVWVPLAFKLDQLEQLEQKNFQKFSKTWTFILGLPFLITPEKRREGKENGRVEKCKKMPTAPSVPRRSPIQVLTGPNIA